MLAQEHPAHPCISHCPKVCELVQQATITLGFQAWLHCHIHQGQVVLDAIHNGQGPSNESLGCTFKVVHKVFAKSSQDKESYILWVSLPRPALNN